MNTNIDATPKHESDPTASTSRPFARMRKRRRQSSQSTPLTTQAQFPSQSPPSLFTVRPNPKHFILNMAENSSSIERLVVDSFIRNGSRTIAIIGLPGSGKTVILRAVAHDAGIHRTFRDAVVFIGLVDATPKSLLKDLCEVVGKVCGISVRVHIESIVLKQDYQLAIKLVANALVQKRMLLILDAVDAIGSEVFVLVANLIKFSHNPGYMAVLLSSRSRKSSRNIVEQTFDVKLPDPTGDLARNILCAHADFDRNDFDAKCATPGNSVEPVLLKCSGLPLALAVAGGAVKRLLRNAANEHGKTVIWDHYRKYLYENFDQFGEISGLYQAFANCLNIIQNSESWPSILRIDTALAALSKSRMESRISRPLLQKLWKLESQKDVTDALTSLTDSCLASIDVDTAENGDQNEQSIIIPKVIWEYCRSLAADIKNEDGARARNAFRPSAGNGKTLMPQGDSTKIGIAQRQTQMPSSGESIQA